MNEDIPIPSVEPAAGEEAEVLAVEPAPMQPVQLGERIELMDILRGFALLGILCVNMQFYTTPFPAMESHPPYWPELHDRLAKGFIELFCSGKFYILFSFLFGMGISVQLLRADARARRFGWHHVRRMLVLLGFGLVHAIFIWMGDVLVTYALIGMLFLIFVRRKPLTLFIVAGIVYVIPLLLVGFLVLVMQLVQLFAASNPEVAKIATQIETEQQQALKQQQAKVETVKTIYSTGTYLEVTERRVEEVRATGKVVVLVMWPSVLAMFLLGLWTGRRGILANPQPYLPFFRKARWVALVLGLAGNGLFVVGSSLGAMHMMGWMMLMAFTGLTLGAPLLTFFYVATIIVLAQDEAWRRRFAPLAFVGRMALTNYLMQSLICTTIFYSHGLGLYGSVGPLAGLGLSVLIFVAQIPLSVWWLRNFRFGPMEWLWRTLTYGKLQPMRLDAASTS